MLLAQDTDGGGLPVAFWIVYAIVLVVYLASFWVVFTKAGKPGWAALIPFYNIWVLLEIVGRPGWWLILYLIPIVNIIVLIIISVDLAKSFGKGTGFAIGLILLPIIFYPILAWGDATYRGPTGGLGGSAAVPPPPPPPAPA